MYLYATTVSVTYEMTIAVQKCCNNGVKLSLNTMVNGIVRDGNTIKYVDTNRGRVYPKVVINAAGLFSDSIAEMAGDRFFTIHPRKGQVALLDKEKEKQLDSVVSIVSLKSASPIQKAVDW